MNYLLTNKRLVSLLNDIRGKTVEDQYKKIEAYVNKEVQKIYYKNKLSKNAR